MSVPVSTAAADAEAAEAFAKGYAAYLDAAKTEREAVRTSIALAKEKGFIPYALGDKIEKGGKYILQQRQKFNTWLCVGSKFDTMDELLKSDSFGNLFINTNEYVS